MFELKRQGGNTLRQDVEMHCHLTMSQEIKGAYQAGGTHTYTSLCYSFVQR